MSKSVAIINCIVQARMGSKRLPGKVMMEIMGKPLIGHLLDRLGQCEKIKRVVVAIPYTDRGSALGEYLAGRKARVVHGPEDDVAERFANAIEMYPCDAFVRVCGDSPLLEARYVDDTAEILRLRHKFVPSGTNIPGRQAEGVETEEFLRVLPEMDAEEREHVTLYWKRALSTVVDTMEDFERIKKMIEAENG